MISLSRHTLVWLSHAPATDNTCDDERARTWHAAERPFVVTRRRGDGPEIGLGFCTTDARHPELRPRRVAACIGPGYVVRMARPPALAEIARCPDARTHREAFERLQTAADAQGLDIRVYGSWMWQALTTERHVHAASDLDVLIDVASAAEAAGAAAFLERHELALGVRIDGELSFVGRGEVQWREYLQDKPEILLKTVDSLRLVPRSELGA